MDLQDELLEIERALWKGAAESYRRNLDAECLVAFTRMAGVSEREDVARSVEGTDRWRDLELVVEGVLRPTPDVALLTYRARAVRGEDEAYSALVSSGYVHRDGDWKMMFHQQAPLEE